VDLGRVRLFEWLTGLAGVVLFVSLFLPWYGAEGTEATASAWQAFSVLDFVLALAALLAIALVVVTAMQRTAAVPQTVSAFVVWMGVVAVIVALIRVLNTPDGASSREIGVWIGLLGSAGVFLAGWNSMRDKRFPRALRPNLKVETIATPAPDGERRDAAG
jgi:hypothetical protein